MRSATPAIVVVIAAGLLLIYGAPAAFASHPYVEPGFAVSGIVVSDTGEPIAGAYVDAWISDHDGASFADKTISRDDGSFTLALQSGKGYINAYYEKWRASVSQELTVAGNTSDVRLVLKTPPPKTAGVEGVVTGTDGAPIEGAIVRLQAGCCYAYSDAGYAEPAPPTTADGSATSGGAGVAESRMIVRPEPYADDYQEATTGADGKFSFLTYPGMRQVSAYAKGYGQSTVTVEAKDGETVRADLKLEKVPDASAVVRGRVLDAATGLPLQGAGVSVSNLEWSRYEYATTGADGAFELKTFPGWSQINVYYYGWTDVVASEGGVAKDAMLVRPGGVATKQYYAFIDTLRLSAGDNPIDVRLEPKPDPTVVLVGYVVDPDAQKGIPGASVSVWNQDTGDWGSAMTDETGSYKILVRPGHYQINAWAERHLGAAKIFVIAPDETAKRVDVELPAGETKYAPCEECGPYPTPMYREAALSDGASTPASAPGAPGSYAPSLDEGADTVASTQKAAATSGPDSTRAASFQGSGGGLPEYDPAQKDSVPTGTTGQTGAKTGSDVPALGLLAALGVLAIAAILLRRRA